MWKSLSIIAIFTSLTTSNAFAQRKVPIELQCVTPETAANVLVTYDEKLVFTALDDQHKVPNLGFTVFKNTDSKTYTAMFLLPESRLVCVVSTGKLIDIKAKE